MRCPGIHTAVLIGAVVCGGSTPTTVYCWSPMAICESPIANAIPELLLPEVVADQCDALRVHLVWRREAAEPRMRAEHVEESVAGRRDFDSSRPTRRPRHRASCSSHS